MGTDRVRNQRMSRDHSNYITKISQNTEKSPRNLKRLAVTQTPVKDQQLTRVQKLARSNIIIVIHHDRNILGGITVNKLDNQTIISKFESCWVPDTLGLVS